MPGGNAAWNGQPIYSKALAQRMPDFFRNGKNKLANAYIDFHPNWVLDLSAKLQAVAL
jgi:hypothetical protein